ncbi:MAG: hypothetical protein IPJ94_10745 [Chloroflexi bacterium]|nr:hypothetical protein [Chloroflexota bacterium]
MSMYPEPDFDIPELTEIAHAAFPKESIHENADELGTIYSDGQFADRTLRSDNQQHLLAACFDDYCAIC